MKSCLRPTRLLLAAAVFHLVVTITISGLGHYNLLPGVFDRNGVAVGIASDGLKVRAEGARRSEELRRGEVSNWFHAHSPFYVKLYSLCFAIFGPIFGTTVLSIEPINSFFYLATLVLVFYLTREFSDSRVALVAAAVVALWPSLVIHTTQLLKDPFFIAGMLAFVLINVRLLSRKVSWWSAIVTSAAGGLVAAFVWLSRDTMGELLIATVALALLLLLIMTIARRSSERRARVPSLVGLVLLIALSLGVTRFIPKFERRDSDRQGTASPDADIWTNSRQPARERLIDINSVPANPWSRVSARVGNLRQSFASEFADAGSNIDTDVSIRTTADVIRYLPRAVMIGYLAPFPNMWLATGSQVSRGGRLVSGMEMLAIYLIEGLAVVGLWRGRRTFSVWFLWLVSAMGLSALGLVVLNIGALYRLRYVFLILLIVLAAEGVKPIFQHFSKTHLPKARVQ
jgi:hypothetical protein